MKRVSCVFALVLLGISISFAELYLSGNLRHNSAYRIREPNDALMLQNRLRLNTDYVGSSVYGYASVDIMNRVENQEDIEIALREAYIDIYSRFVDFRIGKQQVVWGKADGYFINDIVNPLDLRYFLLEDFENIRMGTTIWNTKFHNGVHSLECLVIPEFRPMQMNFDGNWAFQRPDSVFVAPPVVPQAMSLPMLYLEDELPGLRWKNFEYGLKFNTFLFSTDLSLIFLKIREDRPVYQKQLMTNVASAELPPMYLEMKPGHPWVTFYGMNFARPLGSFVFRGEGGYYPSRYYDTEDFVYLADGMLVDKSFAQGMLAIDYRINSDYDLGVQLIHERILDYEPTLINDEDNSIVSFRLNARFASETVQAMFLTLYNLSNQSYLSRTAVDWNLEDNFSISVGVDILGGDSDTMFGQFDQNDNVYLKLKYSF